MRLNIILKMFLVFFVLLNIFTFNPDHNWGGDFSSYISQAQCLLDGEPEVCKEYGEFKNLYSSGIGPDIYPWGYPLLIAPIIYIFGINFLAIKVFTYAFFLGALFFIYHLFADRLSRNNRLLLVLFILSSQYFFWFKQNILSDLPGMFFSIVTIYLIQIYYIDKKNTKTMILYLLGASLFMSVFIRTSFIILLPLLFAVQVFVRRYKLIEWRTVKKEMIPYGIFFFCFVSTQLFLPASSYANNLELSWVFIQKIISHIIPNLIHFISSFQVFYGYPLLMWENGTIWVAAGVVAFIIGVMFFMFGIKSRFVSDYHYILFIFLLQILLISFPFVYALDPRYLIPVFPFAVYFFFRGVLDFKLTKKMRLNNDRILLVIVLPIIFLFLHYTILMYKITDVPQSGGPFDNESIMMFQYVKDNIPHESIVSFYKPRVLHLFTGSLAVLVDSPNIDTTINYYIEDKRSKEFKLQKILLEEQGVSVYENKQFVIYKMQQEEEIILD